MYRKLCDEFMIYYRNVCVFMLNRVSLCTIWGKCQWFMLVKPLLLGACIPLCTLRGGALSWTPVWCWLRYRLLEKTLNSRIRCSPHLCQPLHSGKIWVRVVCREAPDGRSERSCERRPCSWKVYLRCVCGCV